MIEKLCTRCKIKQNISNFSLNSASKDGHVTICKTCKNLEYRQKHPNKYITSFEKNNREINGIKEKCCTSCKEWKTLDNFYNSAKTLDGLCTSCISCDKQRKQKNRKYILDYSRKYNAEHKDDKLKYRQEHKEQARQYKLIYDSIPENKERKRLWSIDYRNRTKEQAKQYYLKNRDDLLYKEKIKRQQNNDVYKEKDKQRYNNNKLSRCFSVSLYIALRETKAGRHWENIVSYTLQDLRQHLELLYI